MRCSCERKRKARRLLLVALASAILALLLYCVPWWIFLGIGVVALFLAGWKLLSD